MNLEARLNADGIEMFFKKMMATSFGIRVAQGVLGLTSIGLLTAAPTIAAPNLVANGGFEINGGVGQIGSGTGFTSLAGWTSTVIDDPSSGGYAFVVDANADSSGFPTAASTSLYLWGPNTPNAQGGSSANGFTGSPDGGYFLGISAGFGKSKVSQAVSGLTVGNEYTLNFQYAGSQLTDGTGFTNQAWDVLLGFTQTATSLMNIPSKGFDGWNTFSYQFTASSTSELLEFTPNSTSGANAPFLLLDGVSITENGAPPASVPGPLPLLGAGAAFAWSRRLRRRIHGVQ